jgi:hypothetical protein
MNESFASIVTLAQTLGINTGDVLLLSGYLSEAGSTAASSSKEVEQALLNTLGQIETRVNDLLLMQFMLSDRHGDAEGHHGTGTQPQSHADPSDFMMDSNTGGNSLVTSPAGTGVDGTAAPSINVIFSPQSARKSVRKGETAPSLSATDFIGTLEEMDIPQSRQDLITQTKQMVNDSQKMVNQALTNISKMSERMSTSRRVSRQLTEKDKRTSFVRK